MPRVSKKDLAKIDKAITLLRKGMSRKVAAGQTGSRQIWLVAMMKRSKSVRERVVAAETFGRGVIESAILKNQVNKFEGVPFEMSGIADQVTTMLSASARVKELDPNKVVFAFEYCMNGGIKVRAIRAAGIKGDNAFETARRWYLREDVRELIDSIKSVVATAMGVTIFEIVMRLHHEAQHAPKPRDRIFALGELAKILPRPVVTEGAGAGENGPASKPGLEAGMRDMLFAAVGVDRKTITTTASEGE